MTNTITTKDGTQIYFKDWGRGQPVVFSHQTDDLRKLTVPSLFIHGDDDQIVPIGAASQAAVKIAPNARLKVYPGAPHGLCSTHKDEVNADLLAFLKS